MHPAGYSQTCACAQLTWLRRKTARRSADWKLINHPYVCTRLLLAGTFLVWQVSLQQCPVALRGKKPHKQRVPKKLGICQTCCDRICLATYCNQYDWQMIPFPDTFVLPSASALEHWRPKIATSQGSTGECSSAQFSEMQDVSFNFSRFNFSRESWNPFQIFLEGDSFLAFLALSPPWLPWFFSRFLPSVAFVPFLATTATTKTPLRFHGFHDYARSTTPPKTPCLALISRQQYEHNSTRTPRLMCISL